MAAGGRCGISRLGILPSSLSSVAAPVSSTSLWVCVPHPACRGLCMHAASKRAGARSAGCLRQGQGLFCKPVIFVTVGGGQLACCLPAACGLPTLPCCTHTHRPPGGTRQAGRSSPWQQRPCRPNSGILSAASRTGLMAAVLDNSTTRVYRCVCLHLALCMPSHGLGGLACGCLRCGGRPDC